MNIGGVTNMSKKRIIALLAADVMSVSLFAGCGAEKTERSKDTANKEATLKVGLVTDEGGVNDGSFNQSANRGDRKSTRLNSSHANISYAVFCLKKITMN